jgi:hypothetical protein
MAPCRAGHQDHGGLRRIAQGVERSLEAHLLHLQARMRPQARCAAIIAVQKAGPCLGQAEQPQRVPRRGRVEDDVVVALRAIGQEGRELVEGCDLRRACAGQLLAHGRAFLSAGASTHLRQNALTIGLGRVVWVDVQNRQPGRTRHGNRCVAQLDPEHLVEVDAASVLTRRTCLPASASVSTAAVDSSLADSAFAGEERCRSVVQELDGPTAAGIAP